MLGSPRDSRKIRVAFVRIGGLSAGGTERWLQMMAASLPRNRFDVTYFYTANPPDLGSSRAPAAPDPHRLAFMREAGVRLVEVKVAAKDINVPTHPWVDTDFWSLFHEREFDLVQTAKSGPAEFPFCLMQLPIVEYLVLDAGVDFSPNIACSIHCTEWQRRRWIEAGGTIHKSAIIPIPASEPVTDKQMRAELDIPASALVAGSHQRVSDLSFSPIPLSAFSQIESDCRYFVMLGGSDKYRQQARDLGLKNIRFVPHSGDSHVISSFLNTLDVFTHGRADGELFGAVFAEAMMHRRPCVSHLTAVANGQLDTVGPAGFVVEGEGAYAQRLLQLFEDADLRSRLGTAGRRHAEEHYSLARCVERLAEIYEQVAHGSPDQDFVEGRKSSNASYGFSDLGCLYPGAVDEPLSLSHHVLTGEVPDAFGVHVFDYFVPRIRSMIDLSEAAAVYGPRLLATGAPDAKVLVRQDASEFCRLLPKFMELNNWQGRIGFIPAMPDGTLAIEATALECLRLGACSDELAASRSLANLILRFRPIIAIEFAGDAGAKSGLQSRIRELDYVLLQQDARRSRLRPVDVVTGRPTTVWCLPREQFANELPAISDWARRFSRPSRLKRRRRVLIQRLNHEVRIRPVLRAMVVTLRRARALWRRSLRNDGKLLDC